MPRSRRSSSVSDSRGCMVQDRLFPFVLQSSVLQDSKTSLDVLNLIVTRAQQLQQDSQDESATTWHDRLLQSVSSESGYTPLHAAVWQRHLAKILLWTNCKPLAVLQSSSKVDHEGLTALELLGKLQRTELERCRDSLLEFHKHDVASRLSQHAPRDEQNELDELDRNLHLLQREQEQSAQQYACNVVTFGRTHHDSAIRSPQRIPSLGNTAVQVAASTHHTLVLNRQGEVYVYGVNRNGRLGTGEQGQDCPVPKRLPLTQRIVFVAAAENHSLCVTSIGTVLGWGSNRFGQVGHTSASPKRLDAFKSIPISKVAVGTRHSCALSKAGDLYVWGDNASGQLGLLRRTVSSRVHKLEHYAWLSHQPVLDLCASEYATLVLVHKKPHELHNSVYGWGHGNHVASKIGLPASVNPIRIACAKHHNAAIVDNGHVYTWGLHADPLGTTDGGKTSMRNNKKYTVPQLVTSLADHVAVAISASDHHTAVVTDCGALYTWGATKGKDVLGHEGVRWQPNPRKVEGVHRAVGVASAKEHTVVLIGSSIPKLKIDENAMSLENLAAKEIAQHVDLFNVIPVWIMAERTDCQPLIDYCNDFVSRNLDGVLNFARKHEMDSFLKEQLANGIDFAELEFRDHRQHPLIMDILLAGNKPLQQVSGSSEWMAACEALFQAMPISTKEAIRNQGEPRRSRSLSEADAIQGCSERCRMRTTDMDLSSRESLSATHESLSKEARAVRKRLNQIARLLESDPTTLSSEEREKISRRPLLEADSKAFDRALKEVERHMGQFNMQVDNQGAPTGHVKNPDETEILASPPKRDQVQEKIKADGKVVSFSPENEETESCLEKPLASPDEKDKQDAQDKEVPSTPTFYCKVCSISCPDENSFALHNNGRKHRNRVSKVAEAEKKQAAVSLMESHQRQHLLSDAVARSPTKSSTKRNPWKVDPGVQPRYRLPPPPHPVSDFSEGTAKQSPRPQKLRSPQNRATPAAAPTVAPLVIPPGSAPALKSPPWASPVARFPASPKIARVPASPKMPSPVQRKVSGEDTPRSAYSLGDFFKKPSPKQPAAPKAAPWSPMRSSFTAKAQEKTPERTSFAQIQEEEEDRRNRQSQSCSTGGKWFVEQRQRADSFLQIQECEVKERNERLIIEEQKMIEEQIMREAAEKKKQDAKKRKQKNSKKNKKKGTKTNDNSRGNSPPTPRGGKKRRSRQEGNEEAKSSDT